MTPWPNQRDGWGASLSGFPILDNYGSWNEPKLLLLRTDTPTLIPVPYLGPAGPGYSLSCSAHKHYYQMLLSKVNELWDSAEPMSYN